MNLRPLLFLLIGGIFLQSCGLFGIRLKLHNPNQPGRVPNFSREQVLLGEMTPLRSSYDVHYYDLSIDFNPEEELLTGTVYIFATATEDLDRLQIDLHPNFEITYLSLGDDGPPLQYTRKERAVFVELSLLKGSSFVLYVDYNGKPKKAKKAPWKGGFVWETDEQVNPWAGVACESDGASLWWPLKDHTADEPDSMRLHYTVSEELMAIGNGQLESKSTIDGKATYNWYVSYPINTYNVTVYIGKFKELKQPYTGVGGEEMVLTHYVLEPNYEAAQYHFEQVPDILYSFEQQFGTYPWYRDGFKLVESPYEGMEHQTAIAYGNGYENDLNEDTDYIILHETAHEWWGNSVTAEDLADVWIQEGFATYAEALYLEDQEGKGAYDSHLFFYRLSIKNKYPVVGVRDRRWFHFRKNMDVYTKGAWILHTLREQINDDDLFRDILKTFYETYQYQIVRSKDFVAVVNEKTGRDFQWFFDQYLYEHYVPELEYTITEEGELLYKWVKAVENFTKFRLFVESDPMPFVIEPTLELQRQPLPKNNSGEWNIRIPRNMLVIVRENDKLGE
ncbi:MAG TPA: hypothetical protein DCP28_30140 [Cytophagales bacterium]|nr:hypothetical protein [Cytophagales bacterium]